MGQEWKLAASPGRPEGTMNQLDQRNGGAGWVAGGRASGEPPELSKTATRLKLAAECGLAARSALFVGFCAANDSMFCSVYKVFITLSF